MPINAEGSCVANTYVRPLEKSEWCSLRDIRLESLTLHPDMFCASIEETKTLNERNWQNYIESDKSKVFGLFNDDNLIGITSIYSTEKQPHIAILAMNYIKEPYRRQGLVKMLYQACINLALQNNHIETLQISHREGNDISRRIILKHGFKYFDKKKITWTDGTRDIEHIYTLDLSFIRNPHRMV